MRFFLAAGRMRPPFVTNLILTLFCIFCILCFFIVNIFLSGRPQHAFHVSILSQNPFCFNHIYLFCLIPNTFTYSFLSIRHQISNSHSTSILIALPNPKVIPLRMEGLIDKHNKLTQLENSKTLSFSIFCMCS